MGLRAFRPRVRPAWRTSHHRLLCTKAYIRAGLPGQPGGLSAGHPPIGGRTIVRSLRGRRISPSGGEGVLVVEVALQAGRALLDVARLKPVMEPDRYARALDVDGGHALPERVVGGIRAQAFDDLGDLRGGVPGSRLDPRAGRRDVELVEASDHLALDAVLGLGHARPTQLQQGPKIAALPAADLEGARAAGVERAA